MRRPARFWWPFVGTFAAAFAAIDLWADGNDVEGDTFSEQWRALDLPDWLLGTLLGTTAAGLYVHLKQRPNERRTP